MVSFSKATVSLLFYFVVIPRDAKAGLGGDSAGACGPVCDCDLMGADTSLSCKKDFSNDLSTCLCIDDDSPAPGGRSCNYNNCCTAPDRRRRRLFQDADKIIRASQVGQNMSDQAPEYHDYVKKCGKFEYDTFLHVDSHFVAIASPKDDAVAAGCPFVALHSITTGDLDEDEPSRSAVHKELVAWKDKKQGESHFKQEHTLAMGTFKASDLVQAFEETSPTTSQDNQYVRYDILTNNCATLMINLATKLGVKIDLKVTSFVARRLLEASGSKLVDQIKSSVNYFKFFDKRKLRTQEAMTDEEVLSAVVEAQAASLL